MLLHWSPSCPEGNETLEQFLKLNKSDLPITFYTSSIIIREANNTFHDRSDLSPTRRTRPPVWEPLPIRRAQCPPKALNPEPSDTSLTSPGQLSTGSFGFFYFLLNNLKYMMIKTKPRTQKHVQRCHCNNELSEESAVWTNTSFWFSIGCFSPANPAFKAAVRIWV